MKVLWKGKCSINPMMWKESWQTEEFIQANRFTLLGTKAKSLPPTVVRSSSIPPDVSKKCCQNTSVVFQVCGYFCFLGGPHIKVQFQALHLMVMALPDANRDTAQVCCIDLTVCHWLLLVRGNGSAGKWKLRWRRSRPAANRLPFHIPTAVLLRKTRKNINPGIFWNISVSFF